MQQVSEKEAKQYVSSIHEYLNNKCINHFFCEKVYTISNVGSDEEITTLQNALVCLVKDHIYQIPNRWLQLKEKMENETKKTLKWRTVQKRGREIGIHVERVLRAAITFFHQVGSLVAFDSTSLIVPDPLWLIDEIKQVIAIKPNDSRYKSHEKYKLVLRHHGVLHEVLAETIWPDSYREELLELLNHFALIQLASEEYVFGICGDLPDPGRKYLVPSQLPTLDEKDFICDVSIPKIRFQSSRYTIQTGTFSRLITRLYWESLSIHRRDAILISNEDPEDQIFLNQTLSHIAIGADQDVENSATLRSALLVIANELRQVAGCNTFEVHLNCTACEQTMGWKPFCRVSEITEQQLDRLLKKRVCKKPRHKHKLADTGYRRWFSLQDSQVNIYSVLSKVTPSSPICN